MLVNHIMITHKVCKPDAMYRPPLTAQAVQTADWQTLKLLLPARLRSLVLLGTSDGLVRL